MKQGFIIVRKATRVYCSIGARSLFNRYTGFDLPVVSKAYKLSKGVYTNHFRELYKKLQASHAVEDPSLQPRQEI